MDYLESYREIIQNVLLPYTRIPYAYGDLKCKTVFDRESDSYLLVTLGWEGVKRVHGCLVHLDIINGKIWVQRDDTEDGVTGELLAMGIPKEHIVLGFHPPDVRVYTEFAIA
ncbi:XisI protein [Desertifilum sp. FACHB-1129]|uniref:FdxN element excision controlling factor protein n=2 Tax=Desertifilum tharense IPPAS B-1220 TaxID=1781255 RepID=A0A1E5QKC7_9CYAN|nr:MULTISPECIES: XisI protein [Desertifilum]MDA0211109.1 XisI protein [Cyanobacteria bacterium FC1]MBD2314155.1 XisI protein [Desertifilum sp. FACHB-1129]MBD2320120.1 XisI protein [Desertifilum sp. FACHB-866]MBD2330248.1 XisI protein [Desertifilum sp. FACHB-868]OEJ75120.1 FdxN element excision controlling factor protein [Desertifilum tharense IPPAS B-1220]